MSSPASASAVVMRPFQAKHADKLRAHHEELKKYVGKVKGVRDYVLGHLGENHEHSKAVMELYTEGCAMMGGALDLVTDVLALEETGGIERSRDTLATQMELHPVNRPLAPQYDRKRLAGGDGHD